MVNHRVNKKKIRANRFCWAAAMQIYCAQTSCRPLQPKRRISMKWGAGERCGVSRAVWACLGEDCLAEDSGIAYEKAESSRHQATCERNVVQRWCWCILVIVALLITGKTTSKLYKSFWKSANEVFYRIILNLTAESYRGNNVVFPLKPFTFKPCLRGSRGRRAL